MHLNGIGSLKLFCQPFQLHPSPICRQVTPWKSYQNPIPVHQVINDWCNIAGKSHIPTTKRFASLVGLKTDAGKQWAIMGPMRREMKTKLRSKQGSKLIQETLEHLSAVFFSHGFTFMCSCPEYLANHHVFRSNV